MNNAVHLVAGLAVASCFPSATTAALEGNPLYLLLGGMAALLPNLLDDRVLSRIYPMDVQVVTDPLAPDPGEIAQTVATAIDTAADQGRAFWLRIHGICLGPDRWREIHLHLTPQSRQVSVQIGDIVNTNGQTVECLSPFPTATADIDAAIRLDQTATMRMPSGDGLCLCMRPPQGLAVGGVTPVISPWRRQASHSLITGLAASILGWLILNPVAAGILIATHLVHLVLDMADSLGCNVCWPVTRQRKAGAVLGSSLAYTLRLAAGWIPVLILYANLAAQTPYAVNTPQLLLVAGFLPVTIQHYLHRRYAAGDGTIR